MKVIAKKTGFYLSLRNKGDEFELEDEKLFSSIWMKKVEDSPIASSNETKTEKPKQKKAKKDLF